MTVREFAGAIQRITGTKAPLVFKPLPVDDPKQRQPDITLARSVLGWEPKVGLDEGLKSTVAYFASRRNSP
jgi:nucleoside-diphosphate-sugar epimerase